MGNYGRWAEEVGSDVVRSTTLLPLPRDQHPRTYIKDTTTVGTHQFSGLTPPTWGSPLVTGRRVGLGESSVTPRRRCFSVSQLLCLTAHTGVSTHLRLPSHLQPPSRHLPTSITPIPNDESHPCYSSQTLPRNLTPPHSHANFPLPQEQLEESPGIVVCHLQDIRRAFPPNVSHQLGNCSQVQR